MKVGRYCLCIRNKESKLYVHVHKVMLRMKHDVQSRTSYMPTYVVTYEVHYYSRALYTSMVVSLFSFVLCVTVAIHLQEPFPSGSEWVLTASKEISLSIVSTSAHYPLHVFAMNAGAFF